MGSYTSVVNDTDMDLYIRYGPNSLGMTIAQLATAIIGVLAAIPTDGLSLELVVSIETLQTTLDIIGDIADLTLKAVEQAAENNGLRHVPPGGTYTSEKLTLSLVHQANIVCCKSTSSSTITAYSGSFTVWTGSSDGSTRSYNLSSQLGNLSPKTLNCVDNTSADAKAKVTAFRSMAQQVLSF